MKKTWRFASVRGEAPAVMAMASSLSDAAKRLGVNRQTVYRWVKANKIPAPGGRRRSRASIVTKPGLAADGPPLSPPEWAAAIRRDYDLDSTELMLLELAEMALAMARDPSLRPIDRLAASARFARIVQQLDLETPGGETQTTPRSVYPRPVG